MSSTSMSPVPRDRRKEQIYDRWRTWNLARRYRAYCPSCGTVRHEKNVVGSSEVQGFLVIPHDLYTGADEKRLCPGGEIDRVADRAP